MERRWSRVRSDRRRKRESPPSAHGPCSRRVIEADLIPDTRTADALALTSGGVIKLPTDNRKALRRSLLRFVKIPLVLLTHKNRR